VPAGANTRVSRGLDSAPQMKVSQTPYKSNFEDWARPLYAREQYSEFGLWSSTGLTLQKYQSQSI